MAPSAWTVTFSLVPHGREVSWQEVPIEWQEAKWCCCPSVAIAVYPFAPALAAQVTLTVLVSHWSTVVMFWGSQGAKKDAQWVSKVCYYSVNIHACILTLLTWLDLNRCGWQTHALTVFPCDCDVVVHSAEQVCQCAVVRAGAAVNCGSMFILQYCCVETFSLIGLPAYDCMIRCTVCSDPHTERSTWSYNGECIRFTLCTPHIHLFYFKYKNTCQMFVSVNI